MNICLIKWSINYEKNITFSRCCNYGNYER